MIIQRSLKKILLSVERGIVPETRGNSQKTQMVEFFLEPVLHARDYAT